MKRAAFLYCADIDLTRFKVLNQRDQLPFVVGRDWGGSNYTLDQAFRLRVLLDLLGGEGRDVTAMAGLGPTYATKMIFNALSKFPRHPLNKVVPSDCYLGVVVYKEPEQDGEILRSSEWIACELERLPAWLDERRTDSITGQRKEIIRIFLVNVTRAAKFVRERADALGLPEGSDYSEIPD
ncbi:hypothetical protein SAMN04488003_12142 [Loktanella fryxellensis]|uniref:Uncharacterized protein n=1 Tax=Loktanella fryxellensis TaxID=245187 RepID=A0A1H8HL39_9RHOB|nr:hypothetical protein [Loktanella fryxellensis]SEN56806.1 hypothetical protein SAMN04488003_12142 [Loktanella fryxellensis]